MEMLARFSDVRLAGVALLRKRAQGGTGKRIEGVKRGVLGLTGWARRCCFGALGTAVLAACTTLSDTFEAGPFLKEQITGDSWRACAAREYQAYARARVRADRDWTEATDWAAKGRAALDGRIPLPHHGSHACECGKAYALSEISDARQDADPALTTRFEEAATACERAP